MTFSVLAISGSLRAKSANTGLVRMAQNVCPPGLAIRHYTGIADLPYYNADLDTPSTWPAAVVTWREAVSSADALLLAAAEYNWSPSAVMKNALDWVSRPPGEHLLQGKVIAVVSAGGGGGGKRAQGHLNEVLGLLGNTMVTEPEIMLKKGAEYVFPDGSSAMPIIEITMAGRLAGMLSALRTKADAAPPSP